MGDWWEEITSFDSDHMFVDDYFFCAMPKSANHYVDSVGRGVKLRYPVFRAEAWEGLVREEVNRGEMTDAGEATVIRWVGSTENQMEVCYAHSSDWYFICRQGDLFFSVNVIGSHPAVHCNDFVFCNSDGSSSCTLKLSKLQDPGATFKYMLGVAQDFIEYPRH